MIAVAISPAAHIDSTRTGTDRLPTAPDSALWRSVPPRIRIPIACRRMVFVASMYRQAANTTSRESGVGKRHATVMA